MGDHYTGSAAKMAERCTVMCWKSFQGRCIQLTEEARQGLFFQDVVNGVGASLIDSQNNRYKRKLGTLIHLKVGLCCKQ